MAETDRLKAEPIPYIGSLNRVAPLPDRLGSMLDKATAAVSSHSPFEFFVFAAVCIGLASVVIEARILPLEVGDSLDTVAVIRLILLCLSAMLSFFFIIARRAKAFRILLAAKLVLLLVCFFVTPLGPTSVLALIAPTLFEVAIYERFGGSLAIDLLVLLPFFFIQAFFKAGEAYIGLMPSAGIYLVLMMLAVIACFFVYYREKNIHQRERIQLLEDAVSRMTESNLEYQHYAHEASMQSQIEERKRITRELHDEIGYTFTNNIMMLEAAIAKIRKDPDKVLELMALARENARTGLEKIRASLYLMRSQEQRPMPCLHKIRALAGIFSIATAVKVDIDFNNFPNEIDEERERFFYYFIQQAMMNSFIHGAASNIDICLLQTDRSLVARVQDDGKGADEFHEGIGISGMRERVLRLGGSLMIANLQKGFLVSSEIPFEPGKAT